MNSDKHIAHLHNAISARSQWHVTPLVMMFRTPEPPTLKLRADRLNEDGSESFVMTLDLTESDLHEWSDTLERSIPASLELIVHRAAGRMVADLRERESENE